jgi:hypothetical protein
MEEREISVRRRVLDIYAVQGEVPVDTDLATNRRARGTGQAGTEQSGSR